MSEILGFPSSELVGKTLQEVVHPDDLEPNLALFDLLVRGELPSFSMEKRFIRRDGSIVWTQVTASVQRNATGQPAYCIAIVQDISERKRLEAELSQAHARLELAVRGSNVRIWDVDMPDGDFQNGRMYTVNFWEHLGYGPETQAETRTALSLLHPDDLEPAMRAVQAALSGEARGFEAEFRVRHNDGTYRWMLSRGAAVRNAAGIPVRFTGSDVDITDLKHAEAALRESEQRFRTFVDHASDAFFLLDQRMVVLDVNRRACQSLGYTRDELVGMTPTHLDADITPADLEDIERRLNVGESVAFESRHRRKDGTVFPVEIRAQAFSEGDRRFTVALARDVTDRKRAEEALRLSEQRYRSLVEATAAVVWTMAASGLAESEQPSWSAFTGQSTDQLAGWGWLDAIHPDDRAHTVERLVHGRRRSFLVPGRVPSSSARRRIPEHANPRRADPRRGRRNPRMVRYLCRYHRPQASRGRAARERGAVPRHVRERRRRHRPQGCHRPLPARQREVLRHRRLHPRRAAHKDLARHHLP